MASVPEATWLRHDSESRKREAPRPSVWCAPPPSEFRPFPSLPRTSEDFKVWTEAFLQARIFLDPCPAPPIPPLCLEALAVSLRRLFLPEPLRRTKTPFKLFLPGKTPLAPSHRV